MSSRSIKRILIGFVVVALAFAGAFFYSKSWKLGSNLAANVTWNEHFGYSRDFPNTILTLVGSGFFQGTFSSENVKLLKKWIEDHPAAKVVAVARSEGVPAARLYVWVEDDNDNLNLYLIKNGGWLPGMSYAPDSSQLLIANDRYKAFLYNAEEAGAFARKERLGIWANGELEQTIAKDSEVNK